MVANIFNKGTVNSDYWVITFTIPIGFYGNLLIVYYD